MTNLCRGRKVRAGRATSVDVLAPGRRKPRGGLIGAETSRNLDVLAHALLAFR